MIIPYGKQKIEAEDIAAVARVLQSDFLTCGPEVEKFEKAFASFIGADHVLACSNGTTALHLAALALGVGPGDRVICSPLTFSASANCIRYCGGDVLFADIDRETLCLDPASVEAVLKKLPAGTVKGIVATDFAGQPCDWPALRQIADRYGLWLIEDACHAPGAEFLNAGKWYRCGDGAFADIAVFSFHPVKHIAMGEGGAVSTSRSDLVEKLKLFRSHGIVREGLDGPWHQHQVLLGYNYRLTDMQAALGSSQLKRIEANLQRRREIARHYDEVLAKSSLRLHVPGKDVRHAYHLYVVESEQRLALYQHLHQNDIKVQIHYVPLHQHPDFKQFELTVPLNNCEDHYAKCLSLPMYHGLTDSEQDRVIEVLKKFISA